LVGGKTFDYLLKLLLAGLQLFGWLLFGDQVERVDNLALKVLVFGVHQK
jgi:multidrug transporter EmrE-like cation transporter